MLDGLRTASASLPSGSSGSENSLERVEDADAGVQPPIRLKRAVMAGATAFLAINLWTGAPLFSLWVGSQAVGESRLSMFAVFVVVLVLAILTLAIAVGLLWLDATYRRLVGHPLREKRLTWLRSFNAQGETVSQGVPMSLLEQIVTAIVYIAVILLLLWFIFLAGSPLPHG